MRELAKFAKAASAKLAQATTEERNGALYAMAAALRAQAPAIVEANGEDMEAARAAGTTEALLDRLMLDESRVFAMADALEEVAALPDPLGVVSLESTLYNGCLLYTSMPIMGGLASQLNFSVETMVMIYSAGNGLVNLFTPTSGAIMGGLALAKIEYSTWLKFGAKLFVVLGIVCMVILTAAMLILPGAA